MVPQIIMLVGFLIFVIYLVVLYSHDIVFIIVNAPILWLIMIRSFFEIRQRRMLYPYMIATLITLLIHLAWFDALQFVPYLWWPTTFAIVLFIFAEIIQMIWHYAQDAQQR